MVVMVLEWNRCSSIGYTGKKYAFMAWCKIGNYFTIIPLHYAKNGIFLKKVFIHIHTFFKKIYVFSQREGKVTMTMNVNEWLEKDNSYREKNLP